MKHPQTKKSLSITELLPYWKKMRELSSEYSKKVDELQEQMRKDLKNDDLIFFFVEGEIEGIGTQDREMTLIQGNEFDKLMKKPKQ